jgi:hypothetical protein
LAILWFLNPKKLLVEEVIVVPKENLMAQSVEMLPQNTETKAITQTKI